LTVLQKGFLDPVELARSFVDVGQQKTLLPMGKLFLLGILAGIYIGFGAHLATTVGTGDWAGLYGLKKIAMGTVFSLGLILVIIPGAELFTGNNLMTVALMEGRIGLGGLLRNWLIVYIANFVGALLLAALIAVGSGLLDGPVGGTAIAIAVDKVTPDEGLINHNLAYFIRGIACNWLVCLAVMMAIAARDITGKVLVIVFPIMAFVASGFEHSIANMYFIPTGILASNFDAALNAYGSTSRLELGETLNWATMWTHNLLAVTAGNIIGGAIFVGVIYFYAHVKGTRSTGRNNEA
jgi:formate/nitrite transporter